MESRLHAVLADAEPVCVIVRRREREHDAAKRVLDLERAIHDRLAALAEVGLVVREIRVIETPAMCGLRRECDERTHQVGAHAAHGW